ncbi:dinitrogenase iron-molybdenum cofactor biosynthesis protein [candidate division WOR-3 bacterium RBG_13_43_14]|uniref:Dinitrogenase iron-molybdenum cofactor biosynthesis protein n=1 Tax=candidate division WOR-3 bacterium RBG_13_43_14 TaxID=1802590 RepID=A0A1F4UA62_UNCW3|nr:MAG: dinitrogenase iron-molybdenum cofactor biosynthesis protein [candidate division WOR-3 bacterium RBG_13_43_14]
MKICITARGQDMNSEIDPRFGRCEYFLIIDTETLDLEAVPNPNINSSGGAGIQSGQLIASKDVKKVLTGNVGPNAFQTLQAAGIEVITGVSGNIKQAVEKLNRGELRTASGPSVVSKSGLPNK